MAIDHIDDPILRIIEQYKNHPSIVAINENNLAKQFSFKYIPKSDVEREILNLDVSKASQDSDIPSKIIKMNADIFAEVLCKFLTFLIPFCQNINAVLGKDMVRSTV